ncbi:MAG: hypothetical protein ACOCWO_01650 [Candidatus Muiribacteriaceae bacterium]
MRRHENKIFLIAVLFIFTLVFSGYTIRNADYMIIADKYIEKHTDIRSRISESSEQELQDIKKTLSSLESDFIGEIREKYSSEMTDRVFLSLSYKKFQKSTDKVMKRILEKEEELTGNVNGMVSVGVSSAPEVESVEEDSENKDIEESEVINKEEKESTIPATLVYAVLRDKESSFDKYSVVIRDDINDRSLVLRESASETVSDKIEDMIFTRKTEIFSGDKDMYSGEGPGEFSIKEYKFRFSDGRYQVYRSDEPVYSADSLIVRLESGVDGFGKAVIWNGKEYINGAWLVDNDGNTEYYDNRGEIIELYGESMWLHSCRETDMKI